MESRKQIAAEKKRCNSHNCAQAILHTYADIAGISEDDAMNIAGAFGGGMGNMEGTCGALVGAGLVLGLVNKDKVKSMKQMRQIMTKFQERNGATQCKLLKGIGTKAAIEREQSDASIDSAESEQARPKVKMVLRECPDCVADAAEFLEEQIICR
jgi:C_GCAxxG_C_C family probable redox protein